MKLHTKRWKNDFKNNSNNELWYDMEEDWPLIEASLNKQYGIRIRKEIKDMNYAELCTLISGLMPDTPLGNIIQIRSEDDEEILKNFTQDQKNIRWKYRNKIAKKVSKEDYEKAISEMQKAFRELAGGSK